MNHKFLFSNTWKIRNNVVWIKFNITFYEREHFENWYNFTFCQWDLMG